jgi:hypothetical protein
MNDGPPLVRRAFDDDEPFLWTMLYSASPIAVETQPRASLQQPCGWQVFFQAVNRRRPRGGP